VVDSVEDSIVATLLAVSIEALFVCMAPIEPRVGALVITSMSIPDDIVTKCAGTVVGANIGIGVGESVSFRDPTKMNVENSLAAIGGRVILFSVGCSDGALVDRSISGSMTGTLTTPGLLPPLGFRKEGFPTSLEESVGD
jgi:hypothetical protein